jgi:hypothetical protein
MRCRPRSATSRVRTWRETTGEEDDWRCAQGWRDTVYAGWSTLAFGPIARPFRHIGHRCSPSLCSDNIKAFFDRQGFPPPGPSGAIHTTSREGVVPDLPNEGDSRSGPLVQPRR